jgi:AmmeMemoRadiSam system protein B
MRPESKNAMVRPPAVAGFFYPADAAELRAAVSEYLDATDPNDQSTVAPKALIAPHAGYIYSGATAAAAYALIAPHRSRIRRVVLVGPSHRVYFHGMCIPEADVFRTPLGDVRLSSDTRELLGSDVIASDKPHAMEHSLEVQLPFLQMLLGEFELIPIVTGDASARSVAATLDNVWGDDATLIIASSDLSHYHDYATAQRIDASTSRAILNFDTTLAGEQACGAVAINGLLHAARQRNLRIEEVARCNSGDTAGDRARVVGYGAFALYANAPASG